jgi:hypothetical protein
MATLLSAAANDYERKSEIPLPWSIAFVIPSLVLASDVRDLLPGTTRAYLANWVASQAAARAETAARTQSLVPFVREGIHFGLRHGMIELQGGALRGTIRSAAAVRHLRGEAAEIVSRAAFVGRWFASEDPVQVFALFGLRP